MKLEPTIRQNQVNGSWKVSDIIGGYLVTRVYFGYSKREALAQFKQEMKG